MWKNKRTNQQNAAAIPSGIPRPPQTIINQAPNEAGRIFAWAIVIGIAGLVAWNVLLSLLAEMGARNPAEALGWFIFGGGGLLLVAIAVDKTLTKYYTLKREFDERIEEIRAERDRSLALTAGAPALPNERLTEEQKKLFENLAIVMRQAYQDYDDKGEYKGGNDRRPWSKASVLALAPPRYGRMSYMKADTVRKWLAEHQVIIGDPQKDQINRDRFPAWADFRALLENEFDMPVVVNSGGNGQSPTLIGRYDNIDI